MASDDALGPLDGAGELPEPGQLRRRDPCRRHLGRLAGERGQDGKAVHRVFGGDPHHRHAAARRDVDQPLVGELEEGLAHGGPADPEFRGELVEIEAVAGLQAAGQDPVTQFAGRLGPDGGADQFDI